ncbi:MAG: tetratricopeptide repeat protein [Spirochaetia bacterium]|jgi:tetratricopeptide (TPR) repeat protein|nr:tetratricopeptide repeat protein [Spirochaetia bacterium]
MKSGAKGLSKRHGKGRTIGLLAVIAAVVIGLGALAYFYLLNPQKNQSIQGNSNISKQKVLEAWNSGDKALTLELSKAALEQLPFDSFYLSMRGIASFYVAADSPEGDERQALIDEALFSLRKALAQQKRLPVKGQVEYVLGKIYFQKGAPWLDLSVQYLEHSIKDGYEAKDSEQFLALGYAGIGDHGTAVQHFERALAKESSDILKLSAAISYKELGELDKTVEYLSSSIDSASDGLLVQRARFLLGEIAMDKGNLTEADRLYRSIVETDPGSAEGWYNLGLVAEALKDPIAARASWRKTTSIDPNHIEARKKLAERL